MATTTRKTAVLATGERFWWSGRQVRSIREDRAGDGFGDDTWVNLYSTTEPRGSKLHRLGQARLVCLTGED